MLVTILITNRKSHTGFRLVPTSITLNDLERRNSPYFAFFHRIRKFLRPIISQWLKIDLYNVRKILFPTQSPTFGENYNVPCSAVSLR